MRIDGRTSGIIPLLLSLTLIQAEDRLIATLIDPAAAKPREMGPAVNPWFWSKEEKEAAPQYSQAAWVDVDGVRCLRIAISKELPWTRSSYYSTVFNGPDYLDPTSDALRLRCRVIEGSFRISFGGPTSYFANSDVFTNPIELTPSAEWTDIVIPLHADLGRNFRRAGFGAKNPVVSYARWIQERMQFVLHTGTNGVLLVERLDLIAQGLGQPFPVPPAGGLSAVGSPLVLAAADLFSAYVQRDLVITETPKITNHSWRPMAATIKPHAGQPAWAIHLRGAEEVSFAGCRLSIPPAADALTLDIEAGKTQHDPLSLDFLFLVADGEVPWEALAPPAAWKAAPETAFDALLTAKTVDSTSLALYHVRRGIPVGATTKLLIPWQDAVCVWSSGALADDLLQQRPLRPDGIRGILVINSWRHARSETPIVIANLQPVALPQGWTQLRSYHQVPLGEVRSAHDPKDGSYGGRLVQTRTGDK